MAVPVARVHLKMAHAALPPLLHTPPKWKMLPVFPIPTPCVAAALPKPRLGMPGRADADERWDAHKTKSTSSSPRSTSADNVRSCAGHGTSRKNVTSPPPSKPSRADAVGRWDAHKKAASPASLSSSSSSGTSSLASSSKWTISNDKKRCTPPAELHDDGASSSTGSNDIDDMDTEEEIVWKPRAMYAGPGFVSAAPEPTMLPMPTGFLVRVA